MNQPFSEKEILSDALSSVKGATNNYNTFANECVHENVRTTLMRVLDQEHEIQQDVFCMMHDKGYYPTPDAEETKITEAKNRFANCVQKSESMW